jgi:hypothetical protein
MSTISHGSVPRRAGAGWSELFGLCEVWTGIAIVAIWLAVLFTAVFAPDFVSISNGTVTRIPSALFVAFFAFLATSAVAKYGFRRGSD